MKITALVTALLATSFCAGSALASPRTASMPRALETRRAHGDTVDRYQRRSAPVHRSVDRTERAARATPRAIHHGVERVRCSDTGADCTSRAVHRRVESRSAASRTAVSKSHVEPKSKGASRMNCSDAGECTSSSRATKASSAAVRGAAAARARGVNEPTAVVPRQFGQRNSPRMACNEGDECSMSSKDARKYWAMQSYLKGSKSSGQIKAEEAKRVQNEKAQRDRAEDQKRRQRAAKHD